MAYDYEGPWGDEVEVPYFSSPDCMYGGVAVGDELHDNVQTLSRTFSSVAEWRDESAAGGGSAGSAPVLAVVDPDCEAMGRTSGGDNVYKAGAKVTIKAVANRGYAFAGWYLDGEPLSGDADFRMASYPYVATGEPVVIKARFVAAEEDAASLALNLDDAAAEAEIAKWEGAYTISAEDGGYLSLKVGRNGDVRATGKFADGTAISAAAPLMCRDGWDFFTVFSAAPSAYKGGFAWLPVGFGAERGALDDLGLGMVASSRNPQATGEYGEGFTRHRGFSGAYYDKTNMLSDSFETLRFMAMEPMLNGNSPTNDCVAEVRFDAKGKPVISKETGLTLSFAQATGVFKGGFTFVFDAKTKRKVNFEGVVVQGQDSFGGFYLWDATGSYADPKTGKPKTYKYKEFHPMTLFAP